MTKANVLSHESEEFISSMTSNLKNVEFKTCIFNSTSIVLKTKISILQIVVYRKKTDQKDICPWSKRYMFAWPLNSRGVMRVKNSFPSFNLIAKSDDEVKNKKINLILQKWIKD